MKLGKTKQTSVGHQAMNATKEEAHTSEHKPLNHEDIGRLILVIVISLCLPILLVGYFFTHETALLLADGLFGAALAKILPYYFAKKEEQHTL